MVYILTSSVSSCCADESVHEKENGYISFNDGDVKQNRSSDDGVPRDDIRVDGGRPGSRSKDTNHFSSCNMRETVGCDGKALYQPITQVSMVDCCV